MKKSTLKVLIYGAIVAPFAVGFYVANYTYKGCELRGGIWSEVGDYCISKDCREKEICGSRYDPRQYCDKVNVGDDLDQAYFWLGEPKKIVEKTTGKDYFWQAAMDNGTENYSVTATVKKQKITQLGCK